VTSAPQPAEGFTAPGFEPLARVFAEQLATKEVGASMVVYQDGEKVVDLWGGLANIEHQTPWRRDTRVIVFSATKGLSAMAFHLAYTRDLFDWDAPVVTYWPEFAGGGKAAITVRDLLNHQAGLAALDAKFTLLQCTQAKHQGAIRAALEAQVPQRGGQAYHAITWGLYAAVLFEKISGENIGSYVRRELYEPVGSDARIGEDKADAQNTATLYAPKISTRAFQMARRAATRPLSAEARILRDLPKRDSLARRAFENPSAGKAGPLAYNTPEVRQACLPWGSATASADGLARAYLPFVLGGEVEGHRFFSAESLKPIYGRQGWSERDAVLQKPVGWSQGFLKEERHLFSPNPQSFGHAGLGGSLGWADPLTRTCFGYVMNKMDWRVRSARAIQLCRALYECKSLHFAHQSALSL
jgi:CubicO group peptidase (beta-lactamase class C family)